MRKDNRTKAEKACGEPAKPRRRRKPRAPPPPPCDGWWPPSVNACSTPQKTAPGAADAAVAMPPAVVRTPSGRLIGGGPKSPNQMLDEFKGDGFHQIRQMDPRASLLSPASGKENDPCEAQESAGAATVATGESVIKCPLPSACAQPQSSTTFTSLSTW